MINPKKMATMKIKFTSPLTTVLIILSIGLTNCDSNSSGGNPNSGSYQETKMTLEETENQNPKAFLSADGTYKKNLLGEWVLEGTITNSATIATYKDVVLNVHFYSKTNSLLGTERQAIYEYFPARQTKKFKIKMPGYKKANSIGLGIEGASSIR